jgi:hypothetical protein
MCARVRRVPIPAEILYPQDEGNAHNCQTPAMQGFFLCPQYLHRDGGRQIEASHSAERECGAHPGPGCISFHLFRDVQVTSVYFVVREEGANL